MTENKDNIMKEKRLERKKSWDKENMSIRQEEVRWTGGGKRGEITWGLGKQ